MKKIIISIAMLFILAYTNCKGLAIKKEIIPNYYLIAVDTGEDLSLSYHEEKDNDNYGTLINATIISVGFNDKYIIIKQKPQQIVWGSNIDNLNYYILPIKKGMNWRTKNEMLGPLSLNQFEAKRKELNISNLTFNVNMEGFR